MPQVKPKKALGQHFLTDMTVAARIADTVSACPGLPVLEIGPGMGVLTRFLLDAGRDLRVVELDAESVAYLNLNFPSLLGEAPDGYPRIIHDDFLALDAKKFYGDRKFCIIGNYPYNISSQIFFKLLDMRDSVPCCSGMLQREVAERLTAKAGTKARGILSVLLQAWYDVEYLFTVSEHVFNPPPKVKSGVIRLMRNDVDDLGCDERLFRAVVKTTFGQRRKTIRNSIRGILPPTAALPPDNRLMAMRPEQLSVAQFIELTNLVARLRVAAT